eukprot:TRINITY_DN26150_c0_g1_i1.p1 TRINITY_DN26150_c0_g1~~TRINITY_DN26150_c0_g1_i1.p1  ORF type:complete len:535 (+),score=95.76 TRINITY_DN26150_c0_g1_i1:71-1675(+)
MGELEDAEEEEERMCPAGHHELDFAFDDWLRDLLCAGPVGERFALICAEMARVVSDWRRRFPRVLWLRLARHRCETLVKEAREAAPVVEFVQRRVKALDPSDGPVTILDLCSGLGFLSMFLAEMLPADRVAICVLIDQAWPMKGQRGAVSLDEEHQRSFAATKKESALEPAEEGSTIPEDEAQGVEARSVDSDVDSGAEEISESRAMLDVGTEDPTQAGSNHENITTQQGTETLTQKNKKKKRQSRTRLNWDHIYGLPWPIELTTRRSDLKLPSTHAQIVSKILEPAKGPVLVLGVHLCGVLSIRALELFNRGPKTVGIVLKPCCLPGMEYVRNKVRWRVGNHSFSASEVCMWGKYNKGQWHGPPKDSLESRFRAWSENLHRGVDARGGTNSLQRIPIVEGHYQDAFVMADRPYCDIVSGVDEGPPEFHDLRGDGLVRHILQARDPHDVLGVAPSSSARSMKRRFQALTKALQPQADAADEGKAAHADQKAAEAGSSSLGHDEYERAFVRVAEAWKEIRAMRHGCEEASPSIET